jgi:hypothetical protein
MLKDLAPECWLIWHMEWKVQGNYIAGFDFFRGSLNASGRE